MNLTDRQLDCLRLTAKGYNMKAVAQMLNISPRTVEVHLRNIKEKFGFITKGQLLSYWHAQERSSHDN